MSVLTRWHRLNVRWPTSIVCVPPPDGTTLAVVELLGGHWPTLGAELPAHLLQSLPLTPVHYRVTLLATMSHKTVKWALWNHKPHAPIFSSLGCFYEVFLSEKWKTNCHTSCVLCGMKSELKPRLEKLSSQANMTLENTIKVQTEACPHSLLPRQTTHDPWD